MLDFLKSIKKALVPLVVSGLVVALNEIGVTDVPADTLELIAIGLVNAVGVWLAKNNPLGE